MKTQLKPEEIEYTALFVDDQKRLLQLFPAKHVKVFAHHSTNWHKPINVDGLEIGRQSKLKIIGQAYDQNSFALFVENAKSKNKYPHITISCAEHIQPVYSNELLEKASENGSLELFKEPFFIEVTEGYADLNHNIILT